MKSGTRLGPYEIQTQLGAGGMGEVYLAQDTRLGRGVAIKVLPAELSSDPERLARLEREARVLASLDHPNLAAVHGLEESDGIRFLVMQLAAGKTLEDRLAAGPLGLDEAIAIARQIADGLEAAHEGGVVHRDLKPANIMVAPGGEVKILDFGLAKAMGPEAPSDSRGADLTASPTVMAMTSAGMILGTAAYMSPEQARGRPLDRRTDIWSFGCVLYEMLAGAKAFDGETVTDVMAAIVTRDPDWSRLPASLPNWLRALLRRCLEKNPRQRLRDAGEARIALAAAHDESPPDPMPAAMSPGTPTSGRLVLVAVATMALGTMLGWWLWGVPTTALSPQYLAWQAPGIRVAGEDDAVVAASPDGRSIAIAGSGEAGPGIWVQRIHEPAPTRITQRPGRSLAWSPDGQSLSFAQQDDAWGVWTYDLRTGASTLRYEAQGEPAVPAWTEDGKLTVADNIGDTLRIVEASAGTVTELLMVENLPGTVQLAAPLAGGRFLLSTWSQADGGVLTGVLQADGQFDDPLLFLDGAVHWVPPNLLLFPRDGSLWAQRFDPHAAQLRGEPVALIVDIDTGPGLTPWLSVGGDMLTYRTGIGTDAPTVLEWVDRTGQLIERIGKADNYFDPRIAPDGRSFVFDLSTQGDAGDIWLSRPNEQDSRLTSAVADETRPVWAPDGSRIVLETTVAGQAGKLHFKSADDTAGELIPVGADRAADQATDWVGTTIIANDASLSTIWIVDTLTGASRPFRETAFSEYGGALAPDGSRIAYVSNETGRDEIWVESFPTAGERQRISIAGGAMPAWRRDGGEILYVDSEGVVTSVEVRSTDPLELGPPVPLFQANLRPHEIRQYDVVPDGQRFLINRSVELPDLPVRLLLGWRQELARRAGPDW